MKKRLLPIILVLLLLAALLPMPAQASITDIPPDQPGNDFYWEECPYCGKPCNGDCPESFQDIQAPPDSYEAPVLTPQQQFLEDWPIAGTSQETDGTKSILYKNKHTGATQITTWYPDGTVVTLTCDASGNPLKMRTALQGTDGKNSSTTYLEFENGKPARGYIRNHAGDTVTKLEKWQDAHPNIFVLISNTISNAKDLGVIVSYLGDDGTSTTLTTGSGGTASQTTLSQETGAALAEAAAESGASEVVIAPQLPNDASKTEVSIPSSAVESISTQTGASLTISTPIADVTIPNGGLGELAAPGGNVTISAEKSGNSIDLSVTAGDNKLTVIPGGVTLAVPAAGATSGTVAVLVREDGTQEVIRQSVPSEGQLVIPLDGSAKVELQDRCQSFDDVPTNHWASDAINFSSSREFLLGANGRFDPEGDLDGYAFMQTLLTSLGYGSDTEYTGPLWQSISQEGHISRQDLVVILWRYMGSPQQPTPEILFGDSTYLERSNAQQWAGRSGILYGQGGKYLFNATDVTNAEAAHMLYGASTSEDSRIRNQDMSEEIMAFTKNNILIQSAQSMLAQANQIPQGVLQLLQ